jgi:type I restriction enzyme S subunit
MNADRLLAHYERIADAPDAIASLRRFILDLAVRGKLVPHDPNDDPGSVLLKRIASEKTQRVKGRLVEPADPQREVPFDLPRSWTWTTLGEICSKTGSGSTPRGGKQVYKTSGVPFLRSQNVYDDGLRLDDVAYIDERTHHRMEGTHVVPGDLLLNITGGSIGRCCIVPSSLRSANVSQHVAIVRLAVGELRDFVHRLILSPYFQSHIINEQTGAGRGGLPKNRMDRIPVALPPLPEQHRIVAKVDELMALCDRLEAARSGREVARDRLAAASLARLNAPVPDTFQADARFALDALPALTTRPDQIKQLRQTILNLAVRGRLVPQDPSTEHLAKNYLGELPSEELPTTWRLLNFGKFCDIEGGNQPPKSQFISEPKKGYVRLLQIRDLGERPVPTYIPVGSTSRLCREGEILIGRYGASVGKVFWAQDGAYNVAMAKFIWPDDALISTFAFLLLKSEFLQAPLASATRSAQAGFNKGDLAAINFPLPPLAEQHRIVAKVDELIALCDRLEASLTTGCDARLRLLDALLAVALAPSDREAA